MRKVKAKPELPDILAELHKHLKSCKFCQIALKVSDWGVLCYEGMSLTVKAATGYDKLYRLRIAAHRRPGGCIYACPDLSKHGEAYSLTAPALVVTGIQDTLV